MLLYTLNGGGDMGKNEEVTQDDILAVWLEIVGSEKLWKVLKEQDIKK